jgi:predicted nucleotidyltransferase
VKSIGIIGEYNPFHQGHGYLIEKAMKMTGAEVCVTVMSGDFTQRGTPAVSDKWDRAKAAVQNGVNVVVELPVVYACNSAEYFARGGVEILEGFGCLDYLAFGSESGDIDKLKAGADFLKVHRVELHQRISELIKHGNSYPKARLMAALEIDPDFDESIIKEPNNILAVEYLKSVTQITPVTIKRRGAGYHESAEKIRDGLFNEDQDFFDYMEKAYFKLVCAKILQSNGKYLENISSAGEGLGNKLINEIRYVNSTEQLIERIKSKAYTRTRIYRLLTQVLLDIDSESVCNAKPYIRLLALDDIGAKFIKEMKKNKSCKLPIITNINREKEEFPEIGPTLHKDILASDMYNIITGKDLYDYSDYIKAPFIGL